MSEFLQGRQPEVWVADRYGGQLGHGAVRQICLAHILRDTRYAIEAEAGDTAFTLSFRLVLLRAVAIGKRRATLKDSTLAQYHAELDRRLDKLLSGPEPTQDAARRLFRAMRRDHDDLFRFVARRDVPFTNNACERALWPSAKRESLCTPYSSICKHWKRIRVDHATRATFPGCRSFDPLRGQVVCTDLMRGARYNLDTWKNARFDKVRYGVVCNA